MMGETLKSLHQRFTSLSPSKRTLTGNFTANLRLFDVVPQRPGRRSVMRQDILDEVLKKTESIMEGDNPMYEDPKDVIEKPMKPPRKRTIQAIGVTSPRPSKEHRSLLREQKRKLTKKYENLVNTLMDRCEDNIVALSEKDSVIGKLKEKLRSVLEYNRLFAEENDSLRNQYETLAKYVEECKSVLREEKEKNMNLEKKRRDLEERVNKFEVPDRDTPASQTIPLVEVCMSCSSRQIVLTQAREHAARLQRDMAAMKDVLYRLNVQLSRYQEKLRSNLQNMADTRADFKTTDTLDSLVNIGVKVPDTTVEDGHTRSEENTARLVDLSGLLSAQALAPLFDAYQENLQEKDALIGDYEKQFEAINRKSKTIVADNKSLSEKVALLEEELSRVRQSYKKTSVEKETVDIEKATLMERAERAETKLKEVYELYEDKMAAMMRDYETVHREYYTVKNALEASEGKMAQLDILRARTVPADLHERRLDHCKRLLEELKHQYAMEASRKTEQSSKLQDQMKALQERYDRTCEEHEGCKVELEKALKNVRLYRKAAVIFRQRLKSVSARASRVRSSARRNEPLQRALQALTNIKDEIKVVKSRAFTSLSELEQRIQEQERRGRAAAAAHRRAAERARLALQHKEDIIRSLIDKVADVEEVRLSQTNTHRLQGMVDTSPELSPQPEPRFKVDPRTYKDDPIAYKEKPGSKDDLKPLKNARDEQRFEPKIYLDEPRTSKDESRAYKEESRMEETRIREELKTSTEERRSSKDEQSSKNEGRNVKLIPGDGGYFQDREGRRKKE